MCWAFNRTEYAPLLSSVKQRVTGYQAEEEARAERQSLDMEEGLTVFNRAVVAVFIEIEVVLNIQRSPQPKVCDHRFRPTVFQAQDWTAPPLQSPFPAA